MKTLFVILDSGTSIRNILRTDVLAALKRRTDVRIVVFSPVVDNEFRAEFETENVIVEKVRKWSPNIPVRIARSLKKDFWAERAGIFTFKSRRKRKERRFANWFLLKMLSGNGDHRRLDALISFCDRMEAFFTPSSLCADLFERYKPDLVFYTTLFTKYLAVEIAAQHRKVKTMAFINSWDNPTSKGPFPIVPDRVIVWNEILKEELLSHHNYPQERILLSGVPQFDLYLDRGNFLPKDRFFQKWGLDPARRLITYTTGSFGMLQDEHEVVDILYRALEEGALEGPCQILLRLHPKAKYEGYKRFEGLPNLILQRPGKAAKVEDNWNPTREDMYGLAELMLYSDVVVNTASTITIDAACFDTPVVNVAFDGHRDKQHRDSCRRFYEYNHYRNVLAAGGVKVAWSADEMTAHINSYLKDRSGEDEGRERIRQEQCMLLDGKSGERIAGYILQYLDE